MCQLYFGQRLKHGARSRGTVQYMFSLRNRAGLGIHAGLGWAGGRLAYMNVFFTSSLFWREVYWRWHVVLRVCMYLFNSIPLDRYGCRISCLDFRVVRWRDGESFFLGCVDGNRGSREAVSVLLLILLLLPVHPSIILTLNTQNSLPSITSHLTPHHPSRIQLISLISHSSNLR